MSTELDFKPELAGPYRQKTEGILQLIDIYNGCEAHYHALLQALIDLEQWMLRTFGQGSSLSRLSDDTERAISREYSPGQAELTIADLMDMARERLAVILEQQIPIPENAADVPMLRIRVSETILPPQTLPAPTTGSEKGWNLVEKAPRLQMLVEFLQRHQVYTDDLVMISGVNHPSMIRQSSYILVEIPRIKREVLVCDEVGEATFVSEKMLGRSVYLTSTKEQLLGYPGVHRIVYRNLEQWESAMTDVLFGEGVGVGFKINVRERESVRAAILAQVPPEEWAGASRNYKRDFKINGTSIGQIGKLFGFEDARSTLNFHLLGAQIYGADCQVIQEQIAKARAKKEKKDGAREMAAEKLAELGTDQEKWRLEIQLFYTPEQWIAMNHHDRVNVEVYSLKHHAISRIFGLSSVRTISLLGHLELGAEIFGQNNPVIAPRLGKHREDLHGQQELGNDPEKWRNVIKKKKSAQEWGLSPHHNRHFEVYDKGLTALGNLFGITSGNPGNIALSYLELGVAIYGEESPKMVTALQVEREKKIMTDSIGDDPERWRLEIRRLFTLQEWLGWSQKDKKNVKIHGRGLTAIGGIFGVSGSPMQSMEGFLELTKIIFGSEDPAITLAEEKKVRRLSAASESKAPVEAMLQPAEPETRLVDINFWREAVQATTTVSQWVGMSTKEREAFSVGGKKLQALSTIFSYAGNPRDSYLDHLQLGLIIFNNTEEETTISCKIVQEKARQEIITALNGDPQKWAAKVASQVSVEQWVAMTPAEISCFNIQGIGLKRITSIGFGMKGDPQEDRLLFLNLGEKIWGENHPCLLPHLRVARVKAAKKKHRALEAASLPSTVDQLRAQLQVEVPLEQWISVAGKDRGRMIFHGLCLDDLMKIFSVEGDPVNNNYHFLSLAAQIYGSDHPALIPLLSTAKQHHLQRAVIKTTQESVGDDPEAWKKTIQEAFSAEEFVSIPTKDRSRSRIQGMCFRGLGRMFGVEGNPGVLTSALIELAAKVYGEDHPVVQPALIESRRNITQRKLFGTDSEQWRTFVRTQIDAPTWVALTGAMRLEFKCLGLGLMAIARIFGIEGDTINKKNLHLDVGRAIFGAETIERSISGK